MTTEKQAAIGSLMTYYERHHDLMEQRDAMIIDGFQAGLSTRLIASFVDLSLQRCYQIRADYEKANGLGVGR